MDIYEDGADVMQGEGARCKAKDILTIENDSGFGLNRLILQGNFNFNKTDFSK